MRTRCQNERAIVDFDEAIRLDPTDDIAYSDRARLHVITGDYEQAIQDYDEAIKIDPTDHFTYSNRVKSRYGIGQYEHAIQDCDDAINLAEVDGNRWLHQEPVTVRPGSLRTGHTEPRQDHQVISGRLPASLLRKGRTHQLLGNAKEAERDFQKAKELGYTP